MRSVFAARGLGSAPFGALAILIASLFAGPALADDGCGAIGWSVQNEKNWFADAKLPVRASGSRLRRIDRAVALDLKPLDSVTFFLPPATRPAPHTYAGEITFFGVPKPGVYQVTLSAIGHVDVFENGMRIKPVAVASAPKCADAEESARFDLGTGDLVLVQVTDVAAPKIKVAFSAAD
jgi:hypothetical protein